MYSQSASDDSPLLGNTKKKGLKLLNKEEAGMSYHQCVCSTIVPYLAGTLYT